MGIGLVERGGVSMGFCLLRLGVVLLGLEE